MAEPPSFPYPGRGCWGKGKRTPFLRPVGEISIKCAKTFLYMFLVSLKLIIFGGESGNRFSPWRRVPMYETQTEKKNASSHVEISPIANVCSHGGGLLPYGALGIWFSRKKVA